ncbi:hypothetical protein [Actinotalea sp. C106]|uniref:hypothetical protein n=1 Tax=Actinotalea sp. C106 TaxID=2908644 RepID=UPI002027B3A8|nr:hypothetical protein [Actinotalea sp. C106]
MSEWFLIMLVPFAVVALVMQGRGFRMLRRRGGQRANGTWEKVDVGYGPGRLKGDGPDR